MEYEKYFVDEELVSFEIEGDIFKYKPKTGGDELKWVEECLHVEDGKAIRDSTQTILCKLRNIKEAPFTKEFILKATGIDKEFKDLEDREKDKLWMKVNSNVLNEIMIKIQVIESGSSEVKKN